MGWWPCSDCCDGGGGSNLEPCNDCLTVTLNISGIVDSNPPPPFGYACGFDNFNSTAVLSLAGVNCEDDVIVHQQLTPGGSNLAANTSCTCSTYSGTGSFLIVYAKVIPGGCPAGQYTIEVQLRWSEFDGFGIRRPATITFQSGCSSTGPNCSDLTWTLTAADHVSTNSPNQLGCGLPFDYSAMTITAVMGV